MTSLELMETALVAHPGIGAIVFADMNGLPFRQFSRTELHAEKVAAMTAGLLRAAGACSLFDKGSPPVVRIHTGAQSIALRSIAEGVLVAILFSGELSDEQITAMLEGI